MIWAIRINRVLLTVLSIMTGAVKLGKMDEEMVIFREAGFSDPLILVFGFVQLAGGLLLIPNSTTRIGAAVMVPTFLLATGVLFINEMVPFGVFSLLFIASAGFHVLKGGPRPAEEAP